ncbi:MAG: hypothetical protein U0869_19420 [Chloroflexota bacterium]
MTGSRETIEHRLTRAFAIDPSPMAMAALDARMRAAIARARVTPPPPSKRRWSFAWKVVAGASIVAAVLAFLVARGQIRVDGIDGSVQDMPGIAGADASPSPAASPSISSTPSGASLGPSADAARGAVLTLRLGDWTARCVEVPETDCRGAAGLFINNLARSWQSVLDDTGGRITVVPRPTCPRVPDWADPSFCWQVSAEVPDAPVCMVVARQDPPRDGGGFGQVGGDDLTGRAAVPSPWPGCVANPSDRQGGPTKGPVPDDAYDADGMIIRERLPDFIAVTTRDGLGIAGYVARDDMFPPPTKKWDGSDPPLVVVDVSLTTVVGHMVPGQWFVPLEPQPSVSASASVPG